MSNSSHQHPIKYRPDIDGLRAIAVLSVVAFHAFPEWISGGFIGVDIFFVISGFLISTILFENLEEKKFSLGDFYSRRIRRIFPALLLVFFACYSVGWFTLLANEFSQLTKHIASGAIFISNFILWNESGYFDNLSQTKPLLHLWSLGIEEQFYVIWPIFLWLLSKTKFNQLAVILAIATLSFIVNIFLISTNPVADFYSPLSRFWELLIGSGLAHIVLYKKELVARLESQKNRISVISLCIYSLCGLLLKSTSLFPGWWALLPTVCGACLIFSGPNAWVNQNILSNRILVWFGLISFPLYLWHWPLLSFAAIIKEEVSIGLRLALIVVAIVLAWLTYRVIERPIRKGSHQLVKVIVLIALMIIVGCSGWSAYNREGLEFRYRKMMVIQPEQLRDLAIWEDKGMYPTGTCNPSFIYPDANICAQTTTNQPPDMVVLGDSHAFSAFWGISKSFGNAGHNVKLLGKGSGCLPFMNQSNLDCRDVINQQIAWINQQKSITTVFISFRNPISKETPSLEVANFEKMIRETFQEFEKNQKKIVYLLSIPEARINPRLCVGELPFGRVINKERCEFSEKRELEKQEIYRTTIFAILKSFPNITVFDPYTFLCKSGECSIKSDETILWMDDNHLSESASYIQGEKLFLLLK